LSLDQICPHDLDQFNPTRRAWCHSLWRPALNRKRKRFHSRSTKRRCIEARTSVFMTRSSFFPRGLARHVADHAIDTLDHVDARM